MKKLVWLAAIGGVVLGTAIVVWFGAGRVGHALADVGFRGLALLVACQLAVFVLLGTAWSIVCPGVRTPVLLWGRLIREGGANCLPFSEIGGLFFGVRAVTLCGVDWTVAAASTVADVTAEALAEAPFVAFGFAMLLARRPGSSLVLPMALGLGLVAAIGLASFLFSQRVASLLRRIGTRLSRRWIENAGQRAADLERSVDELFDRPGRIWLASLVHLISWCGGGMTMWVAFHLLHVRIGVPAAIAIEAMLSGALAVGFLVPGALGVQEASYVVIGALFGVPPHVAVAVSLLRRARDIAIGAPALLIWQALEARRLRHA